MTIPKNQKYVLLFFYIHALYNHQETNSNRNHNTSPDLNQVVIV